MKKTLLLLLLAASAAPAQQVTQLTGQDKILPGKPTLLYSIGEEDGEDWEMLSRVSQVAFDKEDNLYILDGGNHRVLVFDAKGKFVRKIGKKGGGPGELMTPVGLAVTTSDEIAVTDLGRQAVSLFKKDGTFIKNLPLGDGLGFPVPRQGMYAHPQGGVVVRTMPPVMRGPGEVTPGTITGRKSPVMWLTADKQTRLFDIPQPDITPKITDNSPSGNNRRVSVRVITPAFMPGTLWGILPNGALALSTEQDYRIQLIQNGKVTRLLERPFKARKVTEADKAKERERRRKQMERGGGAIITRSETRGGAGGGVSSVNMGSMPKADVDAMIKDMTFNDYMPVLMGMYVDPRGRLWVQRAGKEVGQDGPIDLISANGQYLGTVVGQKLPAAVSVSGRAAYVERDDMDVERVMVKKLPQGW